MKNRAEREAEMRKEYPDMFTHPELKEGEVWVGSFDICVAPMRAGMYQRDGVSARLGNPVEGKLQGTNHDSAFNPIFVNLDELLVAMEKDEP